MRLVGLMSGTSADGIDAVLIEIGDCLPPALANISLRRHLHVPYAPEIQKEIFSCFRPETGNVERICSLNFALGEAIADAALRVIEDAGLTPDDVDLIGSHGQTIYHLPPTEDSPGSTLQIGESAIIAERTGITTISDIRTRDMAAGGHGAPLVSYVDYLLFSHESKTRAMQNIGGIANVTYLPTSDQPSHTVFAFDTGPGNMLIDDAASRATVGAWTYDQDGKLAAEGQMNQGLLTELLTNPYFQKSPPKTTGRELFGVQLGAEIWELGKSRGLKDADIVATVTALTAESIAGAYRDFLPSVDQVIVSGGGTMNPTMMAMLREQLAPAAVVPIEDYGISSDAKEAVAFAVLAYETWNHRPGTLPSCTGARHATVLGKITPGRLK